MGGTGGGGHPAGALPPSPGSELHPQSVKRYFGATSTKRQEHLTFQGASEQGTFVVLGHVALCQNSECRSSLNCIAASRREETANPPSGLARVLNTARSGAGTSGRRGARSRPRRSGCVPCYARRQRQQRPDPAPSLPHARPGPLIPCQFLRTASSGFLFAVFSTRLETCGLGHALVPVGYVPSGVPTCRARRPPARRSTFPPKGQSWPSGRASEAHGLETSGSERRDWWGDARRGRCLAPARCPV